jgi:uncharacterized membrane protein YhhN
MIEILLLMVASALFYYYIAVNGTGKVGLIVSSLAMMIGIDYVPNHKACIGINIGVFIALYVIVFAR